MADQPDELTGNDILRLAQAMLGFTPTAERAAALAREVNLLAAPAHRLAATLPFDVDPFAFERALQAGKRAR